MGAYQSRALDRPDDLPTGDLFISLCAHPGRPDVLTTWLDPAVVDERDPIPTDPALDMFDAGNGPPYPPEFVERYRAAQVARNDRDHGLGPRRAGAARRRPASPTACSPSPASGPTSASSTCRSTRPTVPSGATPAIPPSPTAARSGWPPSCSLRTLARHVEPRRVRVPGHAPPRAHHGAGAGRPVDRRPGVLPERRPRHPRRAGLERQAPRAGARRPLPPPARGRPRGARRPGGGVGRRADAR